MKLAIVTGASSGLGREFALEIDRAFEVDEIWLVARREPELAETASALRRARGVPVPLDLGRDEDVEALVRRLDEAAPDLAVLVNCAGFGMNGLFEDLDAGRQIAMIDLNVRALTRLTHAGLRWMRPGALVIQVASAIAFAPACGWAVYAATKAYVASFSMALAGELRSRGIHCVACCPGPMRTGFWSAAGEGSDILPFHEDPRAVARAALRHGRRGRLVSIRGLITRMAVFLARLVPRRWIVSATARRISRRPAR